MIILISCIFQYTWSCSILVHSIYKYLLVTARKQSLRKGNIFTGVSHSVHGAGGGVSDYIPPGLRTTTPGTTYPPGLHTPRTMYPPGLRTPPPWTVYVRAVRILLECILVINGSHRNQTF